MGATCHQAKEGTLTDSVSLLLTQLNEKDDPTALFHLQPLTALVVLFAYGLLPLTGSSRVDSHNWC